MSLFNKDKSLDKFEKEVKEDVLTEDPKITGQKYAIVSMVSPENIRNRCDVFAFKIRCVCKDMNEVKKMKERFMKLDGSMYSLFVVQVGLWTPFVNNEELLPNIEYQNSALNEIIKGYVDNRSHADDEFNERKNQMVKEAQRVGSKKGQEELSMKKEHPLAVLTRVKTFEEQVVDLKEKLSQVEGNLESSNKKYTDYTDSEREDAEEKLRQAIKDKLEAENKGEGNIEENVESQETMEQLREKMMRDLLSDETVPLSEVENTINRIKNIEQELVEVNIIKKEMLRNQATQGLERIEVQIQKFNVELVELKNKLNDPEISNEYMKTNFGACELDAPDNAFNEKFYS
jgi:hypothetical protein